MHGTLDGVLVVEVVEQPGFVVHVCGLVAGWVLAAARARISASGNLRWPPRVFRSGRRPSLAQRLTVFGVTWRMAAASAVRR
jgi:hypothetical protein